MRGEDAQNKEKGNGPDLEIPVHDILVMEVRDGLHNGVNEGRGVSFSVASLGDNPLKELSTGRPTKTQHQR